MKQRAQRAPWSLADDLCAWRLGRYHLTKPGRGQPPRTLPCRQPVATASRIKAISTDPNRPLLTPTENT